MSSHEDCTADNVDEPLDNILQLPDGFEEELEPVDSQVRCIIAEEPVESGVEGIPDRADNVDEPLDIHQLPDRFEEELEPVPDSQVRCINAEEPDVESGFEEIPDSSDDDWNIFSANLPNRGAVESFNNSFQQDAERSFSYVTPLKESNPDDLGDGIIDDHPRTLTQLTPLVSPLQVGVFQPSETSQSVGEGTAETVHIKRYY